MKREKRETKESVEWVITKEKDFSKAQAELDKVSLLLPLLLSLLPLFPPLFSPLTYPQLYDMMERYYKKYGTYKKAVEESNKLNAEMKSLWSKHENEKTDSVSLLPIMKSKL